MADQRIIDIVRAFMISLPDHLGVKKVYLFGSYAQGNAREESDIDVALILENMSDFFSTQRELMKLRRSIDLRIEPHPIGEQDFNVSNPFAYEIEKTGIEVNISGKALMK